MLSLGEKSRIKPGNNLWEKDYNKGGGYELRIMRTKEAKEKSKEEKEISFKGQIRKLTVCPLFF